VRTYDLTVIGSGPAGQRAANAAFNGLNKLK
jgi:succinate dehydrogenase/fumarate reductase flavoprotein subunit